MATRQGTARRKSRHTFKKDVRERGKMSVSRYMQTFNEGDRVSLSVEPACHRGLYHVRFVGKAGIIQSQRGKCYEVAINDQGKAKMIIVHPIHLKRV